MLMSALLISDCHVIEIEISLFLPLKKIPLFLYWTSRMEDAHGIGKAVICTIIGEIFTQSRPINRQAAEEIQVLKFSLLQAVIFKC
ncbi:unnamed protein product [Coffea canephora]|uniref:Uncharacterized protein n=1 Tax=Coffea canephora TaxID=49390 RepID=A0A068USK0_COFCA|nr:unnamed protein product [Coffea canephora]